MDLNMIRPKVNDEVLVTSIGMLGEVLAVNDNSLTVILKSDGVTTLELQPYEVAIVTKTKKTVGLDHAYNQVKEFSETFNHLVNESPTLIDKQLATNRTIWTTEELVEYLHSISDSQEEFDAHFEIYVKGLYAAKEKSDKDEFVTDHKDKLVAVGDALGDTLYFVLGTFLAHGIEPQGVFDAIQKANMSKTFIDKEGSPYAKYNTDGKVVKSDRFTSPEEDIKTYIESKLKG